MYGAKNIKFHLYSLQYSAFWETIQV